MGTLVAATRRRKPSSANPQRPDEILVGVSAIAGAIDQPERRTYHWLTRGHIKSAVKRGRLYTAGRLALRREFGLVD